MIFLRRKIKIAILLSILFIMYVYIVNISFFPKNILLIQGEKLQMALLFGISISEKENVSTNTEEYTSKESITASSNAGTDAQKKVGKMDLNLNLFNAIPLKDVSVNIIPKIRVVPLGNAIGLKLYTEGVLVVGMTQIEGKKPYENTGIKEGDRIISINDKKINDAEDLIETINQSNGKEMKIKYQRDNIEESTSIVPVQTEKNEYKIGLWVRDASAGVGTATFYIPSTGEFACLGHGISDIDTEELITIASGELVTTDIVSIQKGQKGNPRGNKRFNRRKHKNR